MAWTLTMAAIGLLATALVLVVAARRARRALPIGIPADHLVVPHEAPVTRSGVRILHGADEIREAVERAAAIERSNAQLMMRRANRYTGRPARTRGSRRVAEVATLPRAAGSTETV